MAYDWPSDNLTVPEKIGVGTETPTERLEVKGNLKLNTGVAVGEFSNDDKFAKPGNQSVPTTQAVKTYVDTQITTVNTALTTKADKAGSLSQNFQANNLTVQSTLKLNNGSTIGEFSSDDKFATPGNQSVPTTQAVKTYVDTQVATVNTALTNKADKGGSLTQNFQANNLTAQGNLAITGTVTAANFIGGGAGLTGLPTQWTTNGSDISYSTGNVGIGTANPAAKLNVMSGEPQIRLDGTGNRSLIQFARQGKLQWDMGAGIGAPNEPDNNDFWLGDFSAVRMVIQKGTGRVGIGTTTPRNSLAIRGQGGSEELISFEDLQGRTTWHINQKHGGQPGLNFVETGVADGRLFIQAGGNVGIGTINPTQKLEVAGNIKINGMRTYLQGDGVGFHWFMVGGSQEGVHNVIGLNSNGTIQMGTNRTGPIVKFNDDLWFSDPQDGSIELKNGANTGPGTMKGIFIQQSSATYKQNISPLQTHDLDRLLQDTLNLDLVHFQYKGQDQNHRLSLGVIAEKCPDYIVGCDGKSLSTTEYIAMLHGALKVLATKLTALEQQIAAQQHSI